MDDDKALHIQAEFSSSLGTVCVTRFYGAWTPEIWVGLIWEVQEDILNEEMVSSLFTTSFKTKEFKMLYYPAIKRVRTANHVSTKQWIQLRLFAIRTKSFHPSNELPCREVHILSVSHPVQSIFCGLQYKVFAISCWAGHLTYVYLNTSMAAKNSMENVSLAHMMSISYIQSNILVMC